MTKFRIVIADDYSVLRSGLKLLLETQVDMEVVGEACDHQSVLRMVKEHTPDVMTLNLSMPGSEWFFLLRKIKKSSPTTRIIVLTMHDDPAYFTAAIAAGADAFVLKNAVDGELMDAIRTSTAEKPSLPSDPPPDSITDAMLGVEENKEFSMDQLSDREYDVLIGVAQGLTNQKIAEKLELSVKTIECYRARFMHKLQLNSRTDLVQFAIRAGLLQSDRDASP